MAWYKGKELCFPENNVVEIEKKNYSLHQNPEKKDQERRQANYNYHIFDLCL